MPRIRILQSVAGLDFSWVPGQELDLPAEEAKKWADGVRAELVRSQAIETPESDTTEKAARRPRPKS